jgi:hypothetical protein
MIRRALLTAAVAVLLAPAAASAATLSVGPTGAATYTGAPTETNHVVVSYDFMHGVYLFNDTGASVVTVTGNGCHAYSLQLAYCSYGSFSSVAVRLGGTGSYAESQLWLTPVTLTGGNGTSTLVGGSSPTTLVAGAGQTTMTAGNGNTTFTGGSGPSTMTGGKGHDTFAGGAGGDTINSRNGVAEQVTCGGGVDTVVADPTDTVASDCEQVDRGTSAGTGSGSGAGSGNPATGGPGPGIAAGPIAQILSTPIAVTPTNALPVGVSCPAGIAGGCRVTLTVTVYLDASKHRTVAARRRKLVVARSKTVVVAPGKSVSIRVPLDRRSVRIFRNRGRTRRFKATVTLTMQTEAGAAITSRTLTVHAARRHATPKRLKKKPARHA